MKHIQIYVICRFPSQDQDEFELFLENVSSSLDYFAESNTFMNTVKRHFNPKLKKCYPNDIISAEGSKTDFKKKKK